MNVSHLKISCYSHEYPPFFVVYKTCNYYGMFLKYVKYEKNFFICLLFPITLTKNARI